MKFTTFRNKLLKEREGHTIECDNWTYNFRTCRAHNRRKDTYLNDIDFDTFLVECGIYNEDTMML